MTTLDTDALPVGRPPRVALVSDWWWPAQTGGAERSSRETAYALARVAQVEVFAPARVGSRTQDGPLAVTLVPKLFARRDYHSGRLAKMLELLGTWLNPSCAITLKRRIRAYAPDVVVLSNIARTGPWLLRWLRRRGYPTVRVYHDFSDTCWRRSRVRSSGTCATICGSCQVKAKVMRWASPHDAHAVCVSSFLHSELIRAGVVHADRSTLAYPIQHDDLAPVVRPARATDGEALTVGFIGRVAPEKGVDRALAMASAFADTSGRPVVVLVAGPGQPAYLDKLRGAPRSRLVDLRFPGEMTVDAFAAAVDVAVVPSIWPEPFGRVPVELGVRGVPMLLARVGAIPEAAALSGGRYRFTDFSDPAAAAADLVDLLAGGVEAPTDPIAAPFVGDLVLRLVRVAASTPADRVAQRQPTAVAGGEG